MKDVSSSQAYGLTETNAIITSHAGEDYLLRSSDSLCSPMKVFSSNRIPSLTAFDDRTRIMWTAQSGQRIQDCRHGEENDSRSERNRRNLRKRSVRSFLSRWVELSLCYRTERRRRILEQRESDEGSLYC